jgi:uncharacterized damage-inducible protein DinB
MNEMTRAVWFEREFKLGIPLSLYPNIIERLRGTPARLEDRLSRITPSVLTHRNVDQWSMQEHAGHLLDLGALDQGRLDDFEAGVEVLRSADLENRKTYEAHHNENSIDRILADFRRERFEFVRRLEAYDESFLSRTALHPRLQQPMRVVDLMFFIAEHDDHHLVKITELIKLNASGEFQAD